MSLKIQRILMFVPLINLINFVFWLRLQFTERHSFRISVKYGIIISVILFVSNVVRIIVCAFVKDPNIDTFIFQASTYLDLFVISFFSVRAQEKIIKQKED